MAASFSRSTGIAERRLENVGARNCNPAQCYVVRGSDYDHAFDPLCPLAQGHESNGSNLAGIDITGVRRDDCLDLPGRWRRPGASASKRPTSARSRCGLPG